jgi:hypothetical protein
MSTTADTYIENTKWIDAKLASIFERTTPNDCLSKGDFPTPVRMGKKMIRRTLTRKTSTYSQQLRNQFPTTVGSPPPTTPNAWNNRSRQVPQFNYSVEHFPTLSTAPTPVTPGYQPIPLPHQNAPSLSSQTTMTEEQTRSYIDECVKTEQAKVTASKATLSAEISTLRTEVKTMIDDSMTKQNVVMQGFIRDAIAANTKSMMASDTAPYVTKQEILELFNDFKKDLRSMPSPQPAPPMMIPMHARPPPHHPGYQYHSYQAQYPPRLQHPASPHETPVTSPANKKARARAPDSYARQQPDESEYDVHDMEYARQEYSQYASQPPPQHYAQPHRIEGAAV